MNQPRKPFRINVGFLINQPIGYVREFPFEYETFQFGNDEKTDDLKGTIKLIRTHSGVQALIDCSAQVNAQCVRCLDDFKEELSTGFQELYTFARQPISEDEKSVPEDGFIDFEESIGDYIFLEMPIKPLCRPDCKGLCAVCGQNLNESTCEHVALG